MGIGWWQRSQLGPPTCGFDNLIDTGPDSDFCPRREFLLEFRGRVVNPQFPHGKQGLHGPLTPHRSGVTQDGAQGVVAAHQFVALFKADTIRNAACG